VFQFRNDNPIEELMLVPKKSDLVDQTSNLPVNRETEKVKFAESPIRNAGKVKNLKKSFLYLMFAIQLFVF